MIDFEVIKRDPTNHRPSFIDHKNVIANHAWCNISVATAFTGKKYLVNRCQGKTFLTGAQERAIPYLTCDDVAL